MTMETHISPAQRSPQQPAVRKEWVDRLFMRFAQAYGNKFTSQFDAGADTDKNVKAWKQAFGGVIAGFDPKAIAGALERMLDDHPSWPPTFGEFKAMCKAATAPKYFMPLPSPRVDPKVVEEATAGVQSMLKVRPGLSWTLRIMQRWEAGEYKHAHLAKMAYDVAGISMPLKGCKRAGPVDRRTAAAGGVA